MICQSGVLDAASVFEGVTFTVEGDRFCYGERRFIGLSMFAGHACFSCTYGPPPKHPHADVIPIARGLVRKGLKPLPSKASISLRVDQDVLEWFKAQGAGYQTRINTVLRAFRDASI